MSNSNCRSTLLFLLDYNVIIPLISYERIKIRIYFGVLRANETGNYDSIGLMMTISALAPFIFLSKYGRAQIGITKPKNNRWPFWSFVIGLACSFALYLLGNLMYHRTFENWYVYIGKSYKIPKVINAESKRMMFVIMTTTGMIFSPIGEELFFRGIAHSSFAKSVGNPQASIADVSHLLSPLFLILVWFLRINNGSFSRFQH